MAKTSYYLNSDIAKMLRVDKEKGKSFSSCINGLIDRYYYYVDIERRELNKIFTKGEWNAIYNACSSTAWTPATIPGGVLANIEDSLDEELEMYDVDRSEIEKKLRELNYGQQYVLVELIEEWWDKQ